MDDVRVDDWLTDKKYKAVDISAICRLLHFRHARRTSNKVKTINVLYHSASPKRKGSFI